MNKARLEAFSDGVFAIAITLLVLSLHVPDLKDASSLGVALLAQWPDYLVYAISFATIGIMWLNHHALFQNVKTVTYALLVANLVLLMGVSFLPYPTLVIGRFGATGTTTFFYGVVLLVIGLAYRALYYSGQPAERLHGITGFFLIWNWWTSVGLIGYVAAIAIGWVWPLAAIAIYAAVAAFYGLPSSVRTALQRSDQANPPA